MLRRKVPLFVKVLSGTVGLTGVTVGTLYVTRPDLIVGELMRWQRLRVGLRRKYAVLGDGFRMCYAERGSPQPGIPTVVMLHGYSGSLDAAVSVVKRLPPHMHVIAVDAPGHGKTKQVGDYDLRPKVMAQRLNQFIKKKHLDEEGLHLVGWAMGGTIAGFYAAQYPDDLKLLTLAAPGIYTRIMTKVIKETVDGDTHVLLPVTEEEQKRFWQIVMYKNNVLPKPLQDHFQRMKLKRKQDLLKVMKTMIEDVMGKEDNMFIKHIQRIRTPTQIIWGDKDLVWH